jgi:hypothetical protein
MPWLTAAVACAGCMSYSCSQSVVYTRSESCGVPSTCSRSGELSGVSCGEAEALIGSVGSLRVRVGVGVETSRNCIQLFLCLQHHDNPRATSR